MRRVLRKALGSPLHSLLPDSRRLPALKHVANAHSFISEQMDIWVWGESPD